MRPRRKTEELFSIKFLDRRRGAVDAATQEELLNHRRLHCAHVARLKEVSRNPVLTLPNVPVKARRLYHVACCCWTLLAESLPCPIILHT